MQLGFFCYYALQCPWANPVESRYLMMSYITICTVCETILTTLLLLLSRGWQVMRSSLPQQDVSAVTVLMGATYLGHSAYFVSVSAPSLHATVTLLVNSLNLVVMVYGVHGCYWVCQFVRRQRRLIHENRMEQLRDAVNLKCALASHVQLLFVLYYSVTLFFDGVLPLINYLHFFSSDVSPSLNIYFRPAQDLAE